jgi:phosphate transport system permease protein
MVLTETHPNQLSGGDNRPPGLRSDRWFGRFALAAALMVLVVLTLIVISTTNEASPWFGHEGLGAIFQDDWNPTADSFGALGLLYGTIVVAAIALLFAVPLSIGIALFVTEIAPRRLRRPMVYALDLLAAIPSVVFGLWAINGGLTDSLSDIFKSVSDATSGVPLLDGLFANPSSTGRSFMTAGIVVAIMITPIITAIIREVFVTCPPSQKEAAMALGATRWEMIRGAVFPHARSGIVAAVIIGFGRAVGETIAVALIIGSSPRVSEQLFGAGDTMASIIANQFGEASGTHRAALIGLGVVLLALTVIIGIFARAFLTRADRRLGAIA